MNVRNLILLSLVAALIGACASKRGHERQRPQMKPERIERLYAQFVTHWDFNRDKQITCDDINLQRTQLFARLDIDNNGELGSGEYRFAKFEDKSFMFFALDQIDTNASSTITIKEFTAVSHSEFLSIDKNHDCLISKEEAMASKRGLRGGREIGDTPDRKRNERRKGRRNTNVDDLNGSITIEKTLP